jgi:hypothetical protein
MSFHSDLKRYATVDVKFFSLKDGKIERATVWVSKAEWELVHNVDYLEFDTSHKLTDEFDCFVFTETERIAIELILTRARLDSVRF